MSPKNNFKIPKKEGLTKQIGKIKIKKNDNRTKKKIIKKIFRPKHKKR